MQELKPKKSAAAYWNEDFYLVETFSGRGLKGRDPQGEKQILQPNASAEQLGLALVDALAKSRFLSVDQCRDFFDLKKGQERYMAWIKDLMAQHGYKTKRALFKNMANCWISLTVGEDPMTIKPTHHDRLESWVGLSREGAEDVTLAVDSSPEEIGQALLLAFSRCT